MSAAERLRAQDENRQEPAGGMLNYQYKMIRLSVGELVEALNGCSDKKCDSYLHLSKGIAPFKDDTARMVTIPSDDLRVLLEGGRVENVIEVVNGQKVVKKKYLASSTPPVKVPSTDKK